MDEELKDSIGQTIETIHEEVVEVIGQGLECLKDAVEQSCGMERFFAEGASVTIEGIVKMSVQFPSEDFRIETSDLRFDRLLPLCLSAKCMHAPDWDTLDRSYAYPRVTCRLCGAVTSLDTHKMSWRAKENDTTD